MGLTERHKSSAVTDKRRHASVRLFVMQHCYGAVRFIINNTDNKAIIQLWS